MGSIASMKRLHKWQSLLFFYFSLLFINSKQQRVSPMFNSVPECNQQEPRGNSGGKKSYQGQV